MTLSPRLQAAALCVLTAAISITLAFHRLGANSIFGDEAILANIARNAAAGDHWYPLSFESGRLYVSKPPLSVWPTALAFAIGGVNETNARIFSATGGVLVTMLVFALGTWMLNARAGTLAALLLLTAPPWLLEHGVREAVGDTWTTLFTGLALVLYVRARVTESRRLLIAATAAAAVGSLIKGPVVILIVAGVGLLWEAGARLLHARRPRWRTLFVVVLASAVPFVLWLADNAARNPRARATMWSQFIGRHIEAIDPTHIHGVTFYPRVAAAAFGVWLAALLLPLLWKWVRASETALLLPLLALFPIVAFSFSVSKLPWYVDPALPPLALLLATAVVLAIGHIQSRLLRYAAGAMVAGLLLMRIVAAWSAVNATPRRIDMHRLMLAHRSASDPVLYVDTFAPAPLHFREWNVYYLNQARREWRSIPPAIDRSRCSAVITMKPEPLLGRADFAGAQTRQLHKVEPREADLYVIDLCGGHYVRALGAGGHPG